MSRYDCIGRFLARFTPALLAAFALLGTTRAVSAQSTAELLTQQLLAPALEQIEPRHADVEAAVVSAINSDLERTLQLLKQAEAADPRLAPADTMLARLLIVMGNGEVARRAIESAATTNPNDPEAVLLSGQLAIQQQQLTSAEACFLRGQELCETYEGNGYRKRNLQIMAISGLEAIAAQREQWETALDYAKAWHDLKPNDVQATTRLARDMFHVGGQENREQAYKLLGDAYRQEDSLPRPEISMAQLYASIGEYRRNLVDLAVERDPNTMATRLAACRWAIEASDYAFAEENADAALALDRDNIEALALSAAAARAQGNIADAERVLVAAHQLSPADMNITNALALVLAEQEDTDKRARAMQYAQANFERLQAGYPAQADARELAVTLAWCQYKAGSGQAALQILGSLAQQGPTAVSGDAAYLEALMMYENNNSRFARQILVAALASDASFLRRSDAEALLRKIPAG